ncbi:MAG TPA: FHA domain-containing protein [Gemmatimonas sp.]|nr:FHA domain-containing protein [Gemmatimonas sp.]
MIIALVSVTTAILHARRPFLLRNLMTDGLATALTIIVAVLACIAGGVAWWVHRPMHATHDPVSRVQPLFGGDGVRFADVEDDGSYEPYDDVEEDDTPADDSRSDVAVPPRAPAAMSDSAVPDALASRRNGRREREPITYAGARSFDTAPPSGNAGPGPTDEQGKGEGEGEREADARRLQTTDAHAAHGPHARAREHGVTSAARGPGKPITPVATRSASTSTQHRAASGVQSSLTPLASRAATPVAPLASTTFTPPPAWNGGQSVQFSIPTDGTLQFLPGRLELVAGKDTGREIRFVRLPDAAVPEITFGRTAGTPYRHVQLLDGTVSRMHASMRLENARWSLTNRSTTNPVVCNGEVLGAEETRTLDDGDRIEMGELAFRFRSR